MYGLNIVRQTKILPISNTESLELKADFMPAPSPFILALTLKINCKCTAMCYVPFWGYYISRGKTLIIICVNKTQYMCLPKMYIYLASHKPESSQQWHYMTKHPVSQMLIPLDGFQKYVNMDNNIEIT